MVQSIGLVPCTQNRVELSKFPGYWASADGTIIGPSGKPLRPREHHGSWRVKVRRTWQSVSLLILTAFTGYPPTKGWKPWCIDGDRTNNAIDNLAWASTMQIVGQQGTKRISTGSGMPDDWQGWPTAEHWAAHKK